jgi:hypothetical protein
MKNLKQIVKKIWEIAKTPLILSAVAGTFYLSTKAINILEEKGHISKPLYEETIQARHSSKTYNYKNYYVEKGIDKNGDKYLELRDGFDTRLEKPTTLIWRGDSIRFHPGKDMKRGVHFEDSIHYFKSLNKDSLERIFNESN